MNVNKISKFPLKWPLLDIMRVERTSYDLDAQFDPNSNHIKGHQQAGVN